MYPWLKILLAMKICAVIAYVAVDLGWVSIGERPILAQQASNQTEEVYQEAERPKPTRKGYIDDLLEVPEFDVKGAREDELAKYSAIVEKKRAEVEDRIALLNSREERLMEIEKSIDEKLKKLTEERQYFLDTIQKEKEMSEERIAQLIEFYKKMPPKSAAPVMEKLDKDLVVALFKKLPQKQITSILGLMNPEVSVKLTEYYGRIRSGREYELLREINKSLSDEFAECKGQPADAKTSAP